MIWIFEVDPLVGSVDDDSKFLELFDHRERFFHVPRKSVPALNKEIVCNAFVFFDQRQKLFKLWTLKAFCRCSLFPKMRQNIRLMALAPFFQVFFLST
ncbi:MAG: hypothetical protein AABZ60_18625 [Planctomycetota bacterium]